MTPPQESGASEQTGAWQLEGPIAASPNGKLCFLLVTPGSFLGGVPGSGHTEPRHRLFQREGPDSQAESTSTPSGIGFLSPWGAELACVDHCPDLLCCGLSPDLPTPQHALSFQLSLLTNPVAGMSSLLHAVCPILGCARLRVAKGLIPPWSSPMRKRKVRFEQPSASHSTCPFAPRVPTMQGRLTTPSFKSWRLADRWQVALEVMTGL